MKHKMKKTISTLPWSMLSLCVATPVVATTLQLEIPASVDTSSWDCGYCVFEEGYSAEVEIGAWYVSDDSFKFGEYNALGESGGYLNAGGSARYRDADANYIDWQIRNLGLDSRSVDIEGGKQGSYSLFFNYDGIQHNISDSAKTPFLGNGSDTLTLPSTWVSSGATAGMTDIANSLHNVDLQTTRKRLGIGFELIPADRWETSISARHEIRDGQKRSAGSFFFNSAQLVEPIDYVTDEVEASVSYSTKRWQSKLAYYGSFFNNNDTSLTWQNPYNPTTPGADNGQRALPPDNRFHQFLLTSGYQISELTRITGDIAIGRMEQDENLLNATINPNFNIVLPETSANAKIDTLTADLKLDSAINEKLRLNASWRYNDRDNSTPSKLFDWITTDTFVAGTSRRNLPYSFTDSIINLGADYKLDSSIRLGAGLENAVKDRTNQEVDRTKENTLWGKASVRMDNNVDVMFKLAHAMRDASGYNPVAETDPAQNALLRKYNMADRTRDSVEFQGSVLAGDSVSIGLGAQFARDDYTDSLVGLTSSNQASYNADVSYIVTEDTSLHAFASYELIKSDQAGSQTFSTPNWFATNKDTVRTVGAGVKHKMIEEALDIGADIMVSNSTGEISVNTFAPGVMFPDLETSLDTLKLYADYKLKDNMTLHAVYLYERYDSKDWTLDGVDVSTISNVLSFGEVPPEYKVQALMVSLGYRF